MLKGAPQGRFLRPTMFKFQMASPFSRVFNIHLAKLVLRFFIGLIALLAATGIVSGSVPIGDPRAPIFWLAAIYGITAVGFATVLQTERSSWRFTSFDDLMRSMRASVLIGLTFLLITFVLQRAISLPRSVLVLTILLDFGLMTAGRLLRRVVFEKGGLLGGLPLSREAVTEEMESLILVGDLVKVDTFLRELARTPYPEHRVVGIIGGTRAELGLEVRGVRVIGSPDQLAGIIDRRIDVGRLPTAILFLDEGAATDHVEAVGKLRAAGVRLLRLPRVTEVTDGPGGAAVRELSVEELLSRAPIRLDHTDIRAFLSGKRVLVTGAGGSIGSEICRQVSGLNCAHLSMVDNSEFALFNIDLEIGRTFPDLSRRSALNDVRDRDGIRRSFERERPDIVFHAAALKHVHLVEEHPGEGFRTNVVGTWNVAEAAVAVAVPQMVLISTDKAVDPSNVMGATKRIAENVIRAQRSPYTRFSAVRFGNVLGSAGSVVPIFMGQIERGGPVTVTHEDVKRYFMTIPEAVQLVLHATAESAQQPTATPSVFVLDMGKPMRIMDLAHKMIRLCGLTPERDIAIQITGLKPGEKLTEELVDTSEISRPSAAGVIEVLEASVVQPLSREQVNSIEKIALSGDDEQLRAAVFELLGRLRGVER